MRRLPGMMVSAFAAALTTVAVTVAVPAIADNGTDAKGVDAFAVCVRDHGLSGAPADAAALKPWLGARLERGDATAKRAVEKCAPPERAIVKSAGPSEQELRSCLSEHGAEVPAGDGRVLKQWVFEHGDDAANRDAMKACDMGPVTKAFGVGCAKEGAVAMAVPAGRAGKAAESGDADVQEVGGGD